MSFFMFTQTCGDCKTSWQCSFGIVGTSQIGSGSAKKCPKCGSENVRNESQPMSTQQSKDGAEQDLFQSAQDYLSDQIANNSTPEFAQLATDNFMDLAELLEGFGNHLAALRSQVPSSAPAADIHEAIGRIMHESWAKTKRAQGFHGRGEACIHPDELERVLCNARENGNSQARHCDKFHADLIPWEQLPEKQKDINRHSFDRLLEELRTNERFRNDFFASCQSEK